MLRVALLGIVVPVIAHADESREPGPPVATSTRNALYVEALGKAGPYGVGYERAFGEHISIGVAASFAIVRDQQLATVAPYLHARLPVGKRHALFGDLGPVLVHSHVRSPVPEWDGMSDTGLGAELTVGYELRPWRTSFVRVSYGGAVGEGGIAPFVGLAIGGGL